MQWFDSKWLGSLAVDRIKKVCFPVLFLFLMSGDTFATDAYYFISSSPRDTHGFKGEMKQFALAVAEDLGINLQVVFVNGESSLAWKRTVRKSLDDAIRQPDIILMDHYIDVMPDLLQRISEKKTILITTDFNVGPDDHKIIGHPRGMHPEWIGHVAPNDFDAGYLLADVLIKQARRLPRKSGDGKIHLVAITGSYVGYASENRAKGLAQRVREEQDVVLDEVTSSDWLRQQGYDHAKDLNKKFPQATAYWAAGDALALGAVDALKENGLKHGVDFVAGGVDWSSEAIRAVKNGDLAVTIGGHITQGGLGLLLSYDYINGEDFIDEYGVNVTIGMRAVTSQNIDRFITKFTTANWKKVNFTIYSKAYNPEMKQYNFDLEEFLNKLP